MKTYLMRIILAFILHSLITGFSFAQELIFADNFDSYQAGEQLVCQNPADWTTLNNSPCDSTLEEGHDVQFVQIFMHTGRLDELDTFHGTYQKDLVPGTIKTTLWLTTREQEIIATALEYYRFFSLPDTVYKRPANIIVSPDFGMQILRIKYNNKDKTVVWETDIDPYNKSKYFLESIIQLIGDIIRSKPEYKALPSRKGGYL